MASFNASVSEENRSRETLEDGNRTRNQTVVPQYENGAFLPRNVGNGFHLAVLLSIVSSAIIIFMSIIFITSCLLKHVKKDERRRMERQRRKENEAYWQKMDQQEMREAFYSHKGRNNNINNNNNSKPQQHSHHPIHQTAPNAQALTFKDLQTASRHHQQDYNLNIHSSRPPLDAMPHNSYMNTQTTFVLQPQLLTPRPSSGYNPTLQQSPLIHGSSPTPVVTQKGAFSGVNGQGLKDPFGKNQHSLEPNGPPIWVISV